MIIGSAEEDANTLQFYQIVKDVIYRLTTFMSWSTRRMWTISGSNALGDDIGCDYL